MISKLLLVATAVAGGALGAPLDQPPVDLSSLWTGDQSLYCNAVPQTSNVEVLPPASISGFDLNPTSPTFLGDAGVWTWNAARYEVTDGVNSTGITRYWLKTSPPIELSKVKGALGCAITWQKWRLESASQTALPYQGVPSKSCAAIEKKCLDKLEEDAAAAIEGIASNIEDKDSESLCAAAISQLTPPEECSSVDGFDDSTFTSLFDNMAYTTQCNKPGDDLGNGSFDSGVAISLADSYLGTVYPGQTMPWGSRPYGSQVILTLAADDKLSKVRAKAACLDWGRDVAEDYQSEEEAGASTGGVQH